MSDDQSAFRTAILDPSQPLPDGIVSHADDPASRRFSIYQNNVTMSLLDALSQAFPLVQKLIGPENFSGIARRFLRAHPPTSPVLMGYGKAFPAFLSNTDALSHIGYLPDCARLELATRRSYHAADAPELDLGIFNRDPDTLLTQKFRLAPAAQVLQSSWPIYDIWAFNTQPGAPKPQAHPQDILVCRPAFDPAPSLLPPGAAAWLLSLDGGTPFGAAHDIALRNDPLFDLHQSLTIALQGAALCLAGTKDT
ncbi:MAG: DNA-binding domain-containing protein [Sulfitobacter sp.]